MYVWMQKHQLGPLKVSPSNPPTRGGAWCLRSHRPGPSVRRRAVHRSPPGLQWPCRRPQAAPSASSPPQDTDRKKKAPSGSGPHRLAAVMDAVNERKLPPELRGRGNAVRSGTSNPPSLILSSRYRTGLPNKLVGKKL